MSSNLTRQVLCLLGLILVWIDATASPVSSQQQQCLSKAKRIERRGWVYLHIEGEAKDRGFQHGYLLATEIADSLRATRASWEHRSAMTWFWLIERAAAM